MADKKLDIEHSDSSLLKTNADGEQVMSSYLEGGEELVVSETDADRNAASAKRDSAADAKADKSKAK